MRRHFSTPLPLDGGSILARVAITGEPALMGPELERVARERIEPGDRLNWLEDVLQPRSFLAVPMRSRDEVVGVLSFSPDGPVSAGVRTRRHRPRGRTGPALHGAPRTGHIARRDGSRPR